MSFFFNKNVDLRRTRVQMFLLVFLGIFSQQLKNNLTFYGVTQ